MSVVKTVKSRRALLTALEQNPKDKLRWWDHKQRILEQWLDTSGNEIAVEGASELIRGQLHRGERHEHLRIKCWKHIVVELSALVEDDAAPSNGSSGIMTTRRSSHHGSDDSYPDQDGSSAVELSALSFVDRQEEWLRRKQHSLRAKTDEIERAAKGAANFNPNLAISQNSLRRAQVSAVEQKLEEMATEAERLVRRSSFSQSIQESKRRTEREMMPPPAIASGARRRTRMKRRESNGDGGPRRVTIPLANSHQNYQDLMDSSNPVRDSNSDDDLVDSADRAAGTSQRPEVDGDASVDGMEKDLKDVVGHADNGDEKYDSEQMAVREDEEPPFQRGSFFFKVDDKDKGHYRVRDVSCFLLTSMYKRKDRLTRTPGVSLLVGKLEDPPHEEKVISALFDTDRFSERAAARWWEDNGHRFEDAKSLAEKKAIDEERRRTMERNNAFFRRESAPAKMETSAVFPKSEVKGTSSTASMSMSVPQLPEESNNRKSSVPV